MCGIGYYIVVKISAESASKWVRAIGPRERDCTTVQWRRGYVAGCAAGGTEVRIIILLTDYSKGALMASQAFFPNTNKDSQGSPFSLGGKGLGTTINECRGTAKVVFQTALLSAALRRQNKTKENASVWDSWLYRDSKFQTCTEVIKSFKTMYRSQTNGYQGLGAFEEWGQLLNGSGALSWWECSRAGQQWWLCSAVNVLTTTELFTLKWLVLCYVNFTLIQFLLGLKTQSFSIWLFKDHRTSHNYLKY